MQSGAKSVLLSVQELRTRISDQLSGVNVFVLNASETDVYRRSVALFGQEVWEEFPDVRYDIEEAAKCFSFGRYTAAVFHFMRATEIAVRILAGDIGATIVDGNKEFLSWGIMLSNIKEKVNAMSKGDERKKHLNGIHNFLHGVNVAIRTDTMHPNKTYTEEQAKDVLDNTKAFMKALASYRRK